MRQLIHSFILAGVLLMSTSCQTVVDKPSQVPFHACYQEITDPAAHTFVEEALALLKDQYGGPRQPIQRVRLFHSKRNLTGKRYRLAEGFSKTTMTNSGQVAIYIEVRPGDKEFYPLLGHECGHLLDPEVVGDWEMEGFCMVFSEKLCDRMGHSWEVWRKRFSPRSSDPYARAYWKAKSMD